MRALATASLVLGILSAGAAHSAPGPVYRAIGDGDSVPGIDDPVHPLDLSLREHSSSVVAPDGTVYVADILGHVVYRVGTDDVVTLVAGTGEQGSGADSGGVGTEIALDGPWGLDLDAAGNLYFTEGGRPISPGVTVADGRVRRLDPLGMLETVGPIDNGVKVQVAPGGVAYVSARNGDGTGGVWELDLLTGQETPLLEGVDSEGIALAEDGTLYVAVNETDESAGPSDAYVCALDTQDPGAGCAVIQAPAWTANPVGPQLEDAFDIPGVGACGILGNFTGDEHVVDLEVDSAGILYLLHVQNGGQFKSNQAYGGYAPMVYQWDPDQPAGTELHLFGDPMLTEDDCDAIVNLVEIEPGTFGTLTQIFYGAEISLAGSDVLLHEQTIFQQGPARIYLLEDAPACADGVDNDHDGLTDHPADPGCRDADWFENPKCDDDVDNDGAPGIDHDGGSGGGPADPQCVGTPWRDREAPTSCGLGFELVLALPILMALRRKLL